MRAWGGLRSMTMVGLMVAAASVLSAAPAAAHPTDEVVQQGCVAPTGPGRTGRNHFPTVRNKSSIR